jgi:hypothetical protein
VRCRWNQVARQRRPNDSLTHCYHRNMDWANSSPSPSSPTSTTFELDTNHFSSPSPAPISTLPYGRAFSNSSFSYNSHQSHARPNSLLFGHSSSDSHLSGAFGPSGLSHSPPLGWDSGNRHSMVCERVHLPANRLRQHRNRVHHHFHRVLLLY